jgi:hypothetical protein
LKKKVKAPFDPQKFLAKVGDEKTILTVSKDQIVFHRDRSRMQLFTSNETISSSTSFPNKAMRRSSPFLGPKLEKAV